MAISVVITTHNEAGELLRTIKSVKRNTSRLHEIIVVDDGSSDGQCVGLETRGVNVIRHDSRLGVAKSRDEATRTATGNVVAYLDGHQRVSRRCLDRLAEIAIEHGAIVSVDTCGFRFFPTLAYGADFQLCPTHGFFSAHWRHRCPEASVSRVTSLKAPAYAMPRSVYDAVHWIAAMRGWGGSEAAVSLKAFFAGVDILHLHGPLAKHRFRRKFHYTTTWEEIWHNHAIIARVCFDDRTWYDHWLPEVFETQISQQTRTELESDRVVAEHQAFLAMKIRTDRDFWTQLLGQAIPSRLQR